jgi:hypothetical protein
LYYSTGLASLTSFAAAAQLPHESVCWLVARVLMDAAGGLFGLYLATGIGLLLIGRALGLRRKIATRASGPSA